MHLFKTDRDNIFSVREGSQKDRSLIRIDTDNQVEKQAVRKRFLGEI